MNTALYILLGLAAAGVLYMLVRGVIAMANGRDVTGRESNKYMSYRVLFQMLAIAVVCLIAYLSAS